MPRVWRLFALAATVAVVTPVATAAGDSGAPARVIQLPASPGAHPAVPAYSRFQRTLLAAQASDRETRADFARVTLVELGAALRAEIDLVESELEQGGAQGKLRGWVAAVGQYLRELDQLLGDIEQGYEVRLALGPAEQPEIWVDYRAIIAAHPRPGHQALLEQAILSEFCAARNCKALTAVNGIADEEARPIPVSRGGVRPAWRFDATGPVCEHRGLSVHFPASSDLSRNRALCEQFLLESARLLDEIAWQRRHDVVIQWEGLNISAFPGRPGHVVRLNDAGDSILVTVPIIAGTDGLLGRLVPWIRDAVEGNGKHSLSLDAVELGWEPRPAGR